MSRFGSRRDKLRKKLRKSGVDALLVTNFKNVSYLTGFTGDDSHLLLTGQDQIVISDFRYASQLEEQAPDVALHIRKRGTGMVEATAAAARQAKVRRLGFEAPSMTVAAHDELAEKLKAVELVGTGGLVEELRAIKDKDEIQRIRRAVHAAERAFGVIKASLRVEQTEKEVADELEHALRTFGATRSSFPVIVAAGHRAALPHAYPTSQRIGAADFVLVDWGAEVDGYKSDLTRILVTGKISPKLERVYRVVSRAQQRAIEAVRPGAVTRDVDRTARETIAAAGYGKHFGHGLGHGVGLDIHEAPRMAANTQETLKAGMIITVEPGIYLPGWGGVRLEDDVLVTRSGHEVLTSVPKSLDAAVV